MMMNGLLDRAFDIVLGGREDDRRDGRATTGHGAFAVVPSDQVFVDTIALPVSSVQEAQEAVALQIDRLCPYDPSDTVWDVAPASGADGTPSRRKYTLVAAPIQVLERIRAERSGRAVEAFIVNLADPEHRAVLYDERAVGSRRARRTRLALAGFALIASLAFFANSVETTAVDRDTQAVGKARATATAIATAQQRATQAQTLISAAAERDDALSDATEMFAALSAPAVPGMAIETFSIETTGARLTGFTDDADGLEAALRARPGIRVTSFSITPEPDPMGRGRRFEAQLSTTGADEPS